jgi:2-dehydro-3-deoxygluconokinase
VTLGEAGALAKTDGDLIYQPSLPTIILDRLGAGDALAAGVIHGWLMGNVRRGLHYGIALAALALSQHGDLLVATPEEIETLLANSNSSVSR